MSKGISVACPHKGCRKLVLRYCNFKGEGSLETLCPHCKEPVYIELKLEPSIKITPIIKVLGIILLVLIPIWVGLWFGYKISEHIVAYKAMNEYFAQIK